MVFCIILDGCRYIKGSYQCDNERCIPNAVNCNGHNPCGDNSDCQIREKKTFENTNYDTDNNNVYYNDTEDESTFRNLQNIAIVVAIIVVVIVIICCTVFVL